MIDAPADCQDLLGRLLDPHESSRISLEEVLAHPWLNDGCMPLDQWGLKVKPTPDEINAEAVWYMVEHLNYSEDSIKDSVINFKPNATTGNYFILCQRLRKGNGLPNGAKYSSVVHLNRLAPHARKSLRNSKQSLVKDVSSTTLQSTLPDSKRNGHRAPASVRDQPSTPAADQHETHTYNYHAPAHNGHVTNGHAESSNQHGNEPSPQQEDFEENIDINTAVEGHSNAHHGAIQHGIAHGNHEQTTVTSSPHHQLVMGNLLQQQRPTHNGSHQNIPFIQREKAGSNITTGRETPVNQQVYDIRDVSGDLTKRTSLPDIPHEVSMTPRAMYRDSMKLNSKKRRPKKDKTTTYRGDRSSSVPDHLNVLGASYKSRPGQLADSLALRNTRYKLKYNSKPEDLNRIGKFSSSKPEGLNYNGGAYQPQQPQHCTIDPSTVLHGTHQLTPSEQAQLEVMRAKELLKKQVVNGYEYPDAPPQTPRRYGYVTTPGNNGNKMVTRERTHHYENANVSMDERDRNKTMSDFDSRTPHSSRPTGAYSKGKLVN